MRSKGWRCTSRTPNVRISVLNVKTALRRQWAVFAYPYSVRGRIHGMDPVRNRGRNGDIVSMREEDIISI